jgi:hypothetical protein
MLARKLLASSAAVGIFLDGVVGAIVLGLLGVAGGDLDRDVRALSTVWARGWLVKLEGAAMDSLSDGSLTSTASGGRDPSPPALRCLILSLPNTNRRHDVSHDTCGAGSTMLLQPVMARDSSRAMNSAGFLLGWRTALPRIPTLYAGRPARAVVIHIFTVDREPCGRTSFMAFFILQPAAARYSLL